MSEHESKERPRVRDDERKDGATIDATAGAETQLVDARPTDDLIGRVIDGKYVIEALIGAGGMGKVYRGRNTRTDSPVAIKTLLPDLLVDDTLTKRFEVEAKAASNLRHPNTIRIFDFGRDGDVLFMVMELLDGQSLEQLLNRERPLPPARVLHVVREVCKSLEEAHRTGLIHRDIKPDNIFLNRVGDSDDHVKVLDFGVAKLKNKQYGEATLTQAGMIFGTPRYMSPEQARAFELDGRSDIYALGIIMYEALTGVPPFVADDPVGVLIKHVNEPPPTFAQANPNLPPMPELEAVVMRCIAKDPDERFDDVRNLTNAIDGVAPLYGLVTSPTLAHVEGAGPAATAAFNTGPNTPQKLRSEGFETLGVSSGRFESGPQLSSYTMGAERTDVPTESHERPSSSVGKIAALIGVLVVVAAAALLLLIGGGGDDPAPNDDPTANAETNGAGSDSTASNGTASNGQPPPLAAVAPVVTVADYRVRDAVADAAVAAAERVVAIELTTDPADAGATASVRGVEGAPVALPHTFVFTRDPNSPPAQLVFDIEADGYRDAEHTAPLAPTEAPIVVALRRVRSESGGSRNNGGAWVPPPRDRGNSGEEGFNDPY